MEVGQIPELILSILQFCDIKTLIACSLVNKQFHHCSTRDNIWKKLVLEDFAWQYSKLPNEFQSYYKYYAHLDKTIKYYKTARATIHELNTKDHPLPIEGRDLLDELDYTTIYQYADIIECIQVIKSYVPNIKKGDLIMYPEYSNSDNNGHIFIYNGKEVELLTFDREASKYGYCYCAETYIGAIPIKYSVPDLYPLTYWGKELWITVPFDPSPFIDQLVNNYTPADADFYGYEGEIDPNMEMDSSHTWFVHNHIHFLVVIGDIIPEDKLEECLLTSSYELHSYFDASFTLLVDYPNIPE